ncbi:hypothetical protein CROQUDRAFT_103096 [Cronartium quercuum f. sp. fusiforme G11]|uniref:Uncharacterized protein n=1 Tax=Cronartium quercuum f. sp. fusiforme G11 TaxID=708437 RepID=A0A9P6TGT1_9BASI|nr:hypothetical protein CROQUDRAFT_103096 [Cronartium quercuum f. sp. fusiforme G11]
MGIIWNGFVFDFSIELDSIQPFYQHYRPKKSLIRSKDSIRHSIKSIRMENTQSMITNSSFKVPLTSPKIWMNPNLDINTLDVRQLRTILEFNSIRDDYCRKYQQVDLFKKKVWPKVLIVREKYSNNIFEVSDDELLKAILAVPPSVGEKRSLVEMDPESKDDEKIDRPEVRPTKRLRT